MQKKLITSYIFIMLAGALITGLLFFVTYQLQDEKNVEKQMQIASYTLQNSIGNMGEENLQKIVTNHARVTNMRATIISSNGKILADSDNNIDDLSNQPEIIDALKRDSVTGQSYSDTTHRYYKYFANKVITPNGVIVIRIAQEMLTIDQTRTRAFLVVLIITIIICLIFGWFLIIRNISNIRKLEDIRSHFVSNVTHELKTPLTSIKGFVDTLKAGAIHDESVAERFLEIIEIEADRLYALITDTLELSEIETMSGDTRISDYMLKDIIDEVRVVILPVAEKKSIDLLINISPSISIVRINFDRLKQLLINILDNAIKYNNAGGTVSLNCQLEGNTIIFTVNDNGIGIHEDELPHLFERFYRVDKGRSRDCGGTGLGLSIAKHITQLYKGEIHLESTLGVGSTFIIRLPIAVS